jgi:hypothetical protein
VAAGAEIIHSGGWLMWKIQHLIYIPQILNLIHSGGAKLYPKNAAMPQFVEENAYSSVSFQLIQP